MRILLSNDDGIYASGLRAIYAALIAAGHTVDVFAPDAEQSAASSKLTINLPLRCHTVQDGSFSGTAIAGTPADCVMLGLTLAERPDMVITGINSGVNIGIDVLYSGTVAAALEGALAGIPALAFSRRMPQKDETDNVLEVAAHAAKLAEQLVESLPMEQIRNRVINVNYPSGPLELALSPERGPRVCSVSPTPWKATFDHRHDPRGRDYWWFAPHVDRFNPPDAETDSDVVLLGQGYITVTPLHYELTDRNLFATLANTLNSLS